MEDFHELESITLKSTDGKAIVPAVLTLFQRYHEKINEMFSSRTTDFTKLVQEKNAEIFELKNSITTLSKQIVTLEERIKENDIYERRDTLVFSGSKLPVRNVSENTSDIITNLVKTHLNFHEFSPSEISVSHRLTDKDSSNKSDRSPIIVKLCRRNTKIDILNRARKKKPDNFFVNEHLTPMQATISFVLRKAKRDFPDLVSGSTTFEGKNFVWIKAPNPAARGAHDTRLKVSNHRRLNEFCTKTLKKPLSDYVPEWKH